MKQLFTYLLLCSCFALYANNDKYRLIMTTDPTTTITVAWNQISGANPTVHYGPTDFGTNYTQYPSSKTVDRAVNARGMNNQFARITGLTPDTNYYFVIHDSEGTSQRFWFRTAPADNSRLSFIAGGDSRNNRVPRQNANSLVAKLKPQAVLFGGDMTNQDTSSEWQDWFDDWQLTTASDGRMIPIVPTRGNHESTTVIYNLFDTPTSDSYYAITFGNNLFRSYTLNSEISVSGNQLTWLQNDLAANSDVTWKGAQYHKPMRPHTSGKSEGNAEYNAWAQLFYDEGVRLVVDCDSHTVKTTWPVMPSNGSGSDEGFIRDDENGTVYAGEGCWGAPTRTNNDDKSWTRNSGSFNQFKLIFVDEQRIELRTIKVDNAASVGEVSNNDPFTLPANLDVWNPSEGDVVVIEKPGLKPIISFKKGTPSNFGDGTDISLNISVLNEGNGTTQMDFYVNNVLVHTDTNAPYGFTNTYTDGIHVVRAVATDIEGKTGTTEISINVGTVTGGNTIYIANGDDDVEENDAGNLNFDSTDLEMVRDNGTGTGNQIVGMRFQNLDIPAGATITNAYIQFRSDETNSASADLLIYAEDSGNAAPFVDVANNVSGRNRVSGNVNWQPAAWNSQNQTGSAQRTPDLSSLLQQVVDHCNWQANNSSVFMIEGTGVSLTDPNAKRVADSYNGSATHAPRLVYTYSYNAANATEALGIAFNEDEPNDYSNGSNLTLNVDVTGAGTGIERVEFYVDGSLIKTDTNAPYSFTDTYSNGSYTVEAVASDACSQFTVTKDINVGNFSTTKLSRIESGNDDVEETEDGIIYYDSTDLEMVYDGYSKFGQPNGYQKVGLRYKSVNIPYGATITNAYIQFRSDEAHSNPAELKIYLEDSPNAMPFTASNLSSRTKLPNAVTWAPAAWTSTGQTGSAQQTPNIAPLLQQLVDNCTWEQGNSTAFIIEGSGVSLTDQSAKRVADAFESGANNAPVLVYTFAYNAAINNSNKTNYTSTGWTNNIPNSNSAVEFAEDYNTANGGSLDACTVKVRKGSTLTIDAGDYLNVGNELIINGTLIIEHEGSLVQTNDAARVINNGVIKVRKTTPHLDARDFMILGSPVSGESRNGVYSTAVMVRNHLTENFAPNPDVANNFPWTENFADDNGDNWLNYAKEINPGEGYLVRPQTTPTGTGTFNLEYTQGTLNNGTVTVDLLFNGDQNSSPNMLANPYPSAIDADAFLAANTTVQTLYFWEHLTAPNPSYPGYNPNNYNMSDISMYNATGGTAAGNDPGTSTEPNGYIASGQGFGVKTTAAATAVFNNSMRVTGNNDTYRRPSLENDRIWLNVYNEKWEMGSAILIGFLGNATDGFDPAYDSKRLATPVSLYSELPSGEQLAIQGRAAFKEQAQVQLGFDTQVDEQATYHISINDVEGSQITEAEVYLIDNKNGIVTNLSEEDYVFAAGKGQFSNRFTLQFKTPGILGVEEHLANLVMYPNPVNEVLHIVSPNNPLKNIVVFDVMGRSITSKIGPGITQHQVRVSSLKTGVYFVKIETEMGTVTKKLIKK
ncbi:Ig-like domain-containing protein [Marixanthomonas spongiae]|uniref:T9SS C-terminal target domain-containing protein n=1 Tax=Marixanthomonas spongiae TaxID=2174845 RepID=A0A2U0HZR6_9FLAO|nr:Ig-like domain-containing protein [Marixanthomonas spongiae]PVW14327.1 hypothetical protein DDV96_11045 [Marixanthomonas spongiae]